MSEKNSTLLQYNIEDFEKIKYNLRRLNDAEQERFLGVIHRFFDDLNQTILMHEKLNKHLDERSDEWYDVMNRVGMYKKDIS